MICYKEDHGYPSDWNPTTVGKICEVVGGGTPSRKVPEYWGGSIPWATPTDITSLESIDISATSDSITEPGLRSSAAKVLPAGSILMTSRATIGYCAMNRVPMATNQGFANLICGSEVDSIFMLYWLTHMKSKIKRLASGSTFAELSKRSLRSLAINLPPMTEQKRIAEILHTCDLATLITKKNIKATKKFKKGLMQRLLTRGVGHTKLKKTKIGVIPEEWELKLVREVCSTFAGGTPSRSNGRFFGGSIPWVKSAEVTQGLVFVTEETITEEGLANSSAKWVPSGSTLMAMYGATAGEVGLLKIRATTNQAVVALIPNTSVINSTYLYQCMLGQKRRLARYARGSGQPNLSQNIVREILIPIPPREEQENIGLILSSVDRSLSLEEQSQQQFTLLKKGLMQVLLTGKVRVEIYPGQEGRNGVKRDWSMG